MTRFAPALRTARESKDAGEPAVPARVVPVGEDEQDRLGAQGRFLAGNALRSRDPWTELAQIVRQMIRAETSEPPRLLKMPPSGLQPQQADVARPAEGLDAGDTKAQSPQPKPLEPASAQPGSLQMRALQGDEGAPDPAKITMPPFPEAAAGKTPLPSAASRSPSAGAMRAVGARPQPKPQPPDEAAPPETIVHQWQGAVNSAAGALPQEKVALRPELAADVEEKTKAAKARNAKARQGLTEEATSNVPKAPEVEEPPPPPPSNPVPEQTGKILEASGRKLPDQEPPPLVKSDRIEDKTEPITIEPKSPVIGEQAVPSDLFQTLISPGAPDIANAPDKNAGGREGKVDHQTQRIEAALRQLSTTGEVKVPPGEGEQIIDKDRGPEPMPPLAPGLSVPVGQVVARLLARADDTGKAVLDGLRAQAYAGGVLKKHFPEIGAGMLDEVSQQVNTQLREIAAAADISAEQLETMIGDRRKELAAATGEATKDAETKGKAATDQAQDAGQQTMDAVDAAAKAAEAETLRRQEAAGGASDPTLINRRRDLILAWITEHVTTQTTNYQLAGEKRTKELANVRKQQSEAYKALVQRLIFQIMTPDGQAGRKPRDTNDQPREKRLADLSIQVRTWEDSRLKEVAELFRKSIRFIEDQTKANRKAVESAGTAAREAARRWAEDKTLAGKGWWQRFIARISRWLDEADDLNEQWRVRRTRENRDQIERDLLLIDAAKTKLAEGVSKDAILADKTLSDAQRAVIRQFFEGGNPLDIAASRLRQTITESQLGAARIVFEKELMALPATKDNAEKLNEIVHAMGDSGFDGARIAQECHAAMDQWGTDEDRIFRSLKGLTGFKGKIVRIYYTALGFGDLDADLDSELSGDEYRRAQAQIDGKVAAADAIALHDALDRLNTDEAAVMDLLRNKTPEEIEAITAEYQSRYGKSLDEALKDDLDEGNELDQATALKNGDTATADAIALDDAMRGGITGAGTDEAEIEKVQSRVRDEVLAKAKAENWTSQQMEAEVRRRMAAIEQRFGEKYADVEQYNAPGLPGGSVLRRAFASELSGAELDLANALQDNDLTKADAARIEIERTGFYASDDKLLKVMRSQYERALEARRLDEGPARLMRVRREVERLRNQVPPLSEEAISRQRMALERQMEKELEAGATADAKVDTEALRDAYEGKYHRNLAYTLSFNMSGREHDTALALLKNGGKLSPLQEIELATRGDGTEEDVLKKTFKTMTKAEIAEVRRQWEARHKGKSFDDMIRSELSGRDESDIMDMVEHGAPESAKEQIAQEVRRVERERDDLTGIVGRSAAGSEAAWMEDQVKRLRALESELDRTDWPAGLEGERQREALMGKVEFRVQRVQDAVEDHRRKIDSVTDSIAQVASVVAAVVVGAIVTVLTAGMAGPAAIALVALASSLAGTMATMATKRLVMGGAYDDEEALSDLAVGAVDAVVSVATAGMGDKFLKMAKGVVGKLPVGRLASVVTRPGAALSGALAKTSLAGTATRIGESAMLGKSLKTPVIGGALHHAGGSLRNVGKVLSDPAEMVEASARFLGRSMENVVTAMPANAAQIGLSDDTWKGDPLANFASGMAGGSWQAFYMGHLMSGPAELAQKSLVHGMQMRSSVGRMQLAGQMVSEGYGAFREKNPGASIGDFMMHPEGRKLRAEIDRMGLLPTVESVSTKVAADPAARADLDKGQGAVPDRARNEERVAQLEAGLPQDMKAKAFVTPDAELAGNTVRVEPLKIGDRIVGVDIRVGPEATALDIAMHAATAHTMLKYAGLGGRVFAAMERLGAMMAGSDVRVGRRGWEAQAEMAKLPAIIDARIRALEGEMITPEIAMRLQEEIASLTVQFHEHEAIALDPVAGAMEGRGFVAAEDRSAGASGSAKLRAAFEEAGPLRDPSGALTELGRFGLEMRLDEARTLLGEARLLSEGKYRTKADDAKIAAKQKEASQVLRDAANRYDLDFDALYHHVANKDGHPDIKKALRPPKADPDTQAAGPSSALRRDPAQGELDKALAALAQPDPDGPMALVAKMRAGGLEAVGAQQAINAMSSAPANARVVDFPTATLEIAFAAAGGVPHGGREGGVTVEINGISMFLFSPKPEDIHTHPYPPPRVAFECSLPRAEAGKPVVYQFGDGELRVWYSEPTRDHPGGLLKQEAIVGPRRDRMGHEDQYRTHGENDLAGAPTQLAHAMGAGRMVESSFGISRAPEEVNQILQAKGIEAMMARLRDALPPGATLSYETTVEFHEGSMRLKRVEYRLDITIQGRRLPFAEFAIDVETNRLVEPKVGKETASGKGSKQPLPAKDPRTHFLETASVTVDPLMSRHSQFERINTLFDHLREAIDVPQQLIFGLRFARPEHVMVAEALARMSSERVAAEAAKHEQFASHRPLEGAAFEPQAWRDRLDQMLADPDAPRYIVIDLRGLDLSAAAREAIQGALRSVGRAKMYRLIVLE